MGVSTLFRIRIRVFKFPNYIVCPNKNQKKALDNIRMNI